MSILMKSQDNAQRKEKLASSIADFAKEMAVLTAKSIFNNINETTDQHSIHQIPVEEKEEETNKSKRSFLVKRNNAHIDRPSIFQSQLSSITLKPNEGYQMKKESKVTTNNSTPCHNTYQYDHQKRTNSDDFIQNKVNSLLTNELNDLDSSDEAITFDDFSESEKWTEDLMSNNKYASDRTNNNNNDYAYSSKGKMTLYEKSMKSINFLKAKLNEERTKKRENMDNQLQHFPEITFKSRRIVEKKNDYTPLYLRAAQIHSKKRAMIKLEKKKREMEKELNKEEESYKKKTLQKENHEEKVKVKKSKQLTEGNYAFISRQEKWNDYVIYKKKTMKLQKDSPKIENTFKPHINNMSNAIVTKLTSENITNNNNQHQQVNSVFNRLFNDKEDHDARQQYRNDKAKYSFKPKLNHYMPSFMRKRQGTALSQSCSSNIHITTNEVISNHSPQIQTKPTFPNHSLPNESLKKQPTSLSVSRNSPNQIKLISQDNDITCIKSRNLNKATGEKYKENRGEDEEYVIAQYKLALNQITNYKLQSQKLSSTHTDDNTTNFSVYNHCLSKTRDDNTNNTNCKTKKSLKRSTSNVTTCLGIPDMFRRNMNIVEETQCRKKK